MPKVDAELQIKIVGDMPAGLPSFVMPVACLKVGCNGMIRHGIFVDAGDFEQSPFLERFKCVERHESNSGRIPKLSRIVSNSQPKRTSQ